MRIEGLLSLLHDRALIEGRDFGMRLEPTAYEFVFYDTRLALDALRSGARVPPSRSAQGH
jgi:hypothetical protein